MNKILCVTTVPATLSAFILPFAYHFRAKGWRVDGMAQGISTDVDCLKAFDKVWEVEWSRNPLQLQNLTVAPRQIREVVEREKYDLVHVHTPVAAFVTRYALNSLRQQGKPKIIYTAHGFHFYRGGQLLRNAAFFGLEKLAGNWTDYLVVMNREDEEAAKRYRLVPPDRVRYMPGIGINSSNYNPESVSEAKILQVRQKLGIAPETPLLLSAAEFNPRKRHWDLLRAFARLARPQVHLALAGDGKLQAQMQQLAADLGIQNRVHFLGYRQDIQVLMRACVAILLPSEQEGLPRSIMEAMCLESPVIGSNIRGIRDLLEGGYGLLVQKGDVNALAEAMAWVLDNPEAAKRMGQRGRERMATYELEQIINMHEILYAEATQADNYAVLSR